MVKPKAGFPQELKIDWKNTVAIWKRLEFDSESGQTNDFKIGIHSFPAWSSTIKEQWAKQAGKFTCYEVG